MADDRTPSQRSETMRRVRSRDTSCEMLLRRAAHAKGLRYRVRSALPGKPDMVFAGPRVVVFVDGCFWHGCAEHCRLPASNREYWENKIERNAARDAATTDLLEREGWRVVRLWEHEVRLNPERCAARIGQLVRGCKKRA